MTLLASAVLGAYLVVLSLLFVYGANCALMALLRARLPPADHRARVDGDEPAVTVQLPIYNEKYVLPRLLESVARLDWPRDRLRVQLLDDSDDDTRDAAAALAAEWRAQGLRVEHVTRASREGYKAGALAEGLRRSDSKFVAIFDADFVPPPDFLRRTIAPLVADPRVACAQARWGHVNPDYSWLTRAQALGVDGHFSVEQRVRHERGLLMNFNGTAGTWRRAAIEDAGGWSHDTLAEDLDLSYRAQLRGWRIAYLEDAECPAEIPAQMQALKRQQFRWAKGSIQCLRKHAGAVLRSPRLRPFAKAQALLHLSHYAVHPLMLALSLLLLPLVVLTSVPFPLALGLLGATFGPPAMYAVGQRARHPESWRRRLVTLVPLTLVGIGIAASNARAVLEGLVRRGGEFRRTPKFRIEQTGDSWRDKPYALRGEWSGWAEAALVLLMVATAAAALWRGSWFVLPWAILFGAAYGTVLFTSLAHQRAAAPPQEAPHAVPAQ